MPRAVEEPVPANIEERLDRLERMVKSLLDQQNPRRGRVEFNGREFDAQALGDLKANDEARAEFKREAARAAEMEKRAAKQAEKAAKFQEKMADLGPLKDGLQAQLKALQEQREALQRAMEGLHQQLKALESRQDLMREQIKRRHSEDRDDAEEK
jgi:chromosome segregation ATPase